MLKPYKKTKYLAAGTAKALNEMLAELNNHREPNELSLSLKGKKVLEWVDALRSLQGEYEALQRKVEHLER